MESKSLTFQILPNPYAGTWEQGNRNILQSITNVPPHSPDGRRLCLLSNFTPHNLNFILQVVRQPTACKTAGWKECVTLSERRHQMKSLPLSHDSFTKKCSCAVCIEGKVQQLVPMSDDSLGLCSESIQTCQVPSSTVSGAQIWIWTSKSTSLSLCARFL